MAQVGLPAPKFKLPSTKGATSAKNLGHEIALSDYAGQWLVFFFYPLDFTFVCPTEITALSDRYEEFGALGADIRGASTDSVHSHFAWLNTPLDKNGIAGVKYPLVAGPTQPCAIDNEHELVDRFQNQFVPAYYAFNRNHELRHFQAGDKGYDRIAAAIERVLQDKEAAA